MQLIVEIALGIVLGVALVIVLGVVLLLYWRWVLAGVVVIVFALWLAWDSDRRRSAEADADDHPAIAAKCTTTPERFVARYRADYPKETAGQSDAAILKQVLGDYPEWAPKVCRNGVPVVP